MTGNTNINIKERLESIDKIFEDERLHPNVYETDGLPKYYKHLPKTNMSELIKASANLLQKKSEPNNFFYSFHDVLNVSTKEVVKRTRLSRLDAIHTKSFASITGISRYLCLPDFFNLIGGKNLFRGIHRYPGNLRAGTMFAQRLLKAKWFDKDPQNDEFGTLVESIQVPKRHYNIEPEDFLKEREVTLKQGEYKEIIVLNVTNYTLHSPVPFLLDFSQIIAFETPPKRRTSVFQNEELAQKYPHSFEGITLQIKGINGCFYFQSTFRNFMDTDGGEYFRDMNLDCSFTSAPTEGVKFSDQADGGSFSVDKSFTSPITFNPKAGNDVLEFEQGEYFVLEVERNHGLDMYLFHPGTGGEICLEGNKDEYELVTMGKDLLLKQVNTNNEHGVLVKNYFDQSTNIMLTYGARLTLTDF